MLDGENYLSLVTFRKDGSEVPTPVWFAEYDGRLWVFTERASYKVKRLARNPACRVAACGMLGRVTGPWHDGTARVVDDAAAVERAKRALLEKYGWQLRVTDFLSTLAGRIDGRAYLEITLDS